MPTGRAYTIDSDWFVEDETGNILEVLEGEHYRLHPILLRARDENRRVEFELVAGDVAQFVHIKRLL